MKFKSKMQKSILILIVLISLTSLISSNQVLAASKSNKGTYVKSFNSGRYYRAVIIKKISGKKITFKMTYSSLRYEGWSNTIKGKIKKNKVTFKFKEAYTDSKTGKGTLVLHKNYVTLRTKLSNNCLSTNGKKIKIKKKDNSTDDRY